MTQKGNGEDEDEGIAGTSLVPSTEGIALFDQSIRSAENKRSIRDDKPFLPVPHSEDSKWDKRSG